MYIQHPVFSPIPPEPTSYIVSGSASLYIDTNMRKKVFLSLSSQYRRGNPTLIDDGCFSYIQHIGCELDVIFAWFLVHDRCPLDSLHDEGILLLSSLVDFVERMYSMGLCTRFVADLGGVLCYRYSVW